MAPPASQRRHSLPTTAINTSRDKVRPVEVAVKVARPEHRVGMAHADRLEAVPEATSLGRLHERYTGDRGGHNRPKNKPHEVTSFGCYLPEQHRRVDKKSQPIR